MSSSFDPTVIIAALNRAGVEYVVIGAWAVEAQGVRRSEPTQDIDITPRATEANLRRLSEALRDLTARIRVDGVDGGLDFDHDAGSLARARVWNLTCSAGDLDISFEPAAFADGYDGLVGGAVLVELTGTETVTVTVAAVADVVRSKQAAGRAKDLRALPEIIDQARRLGLLGH